MGPGPESTFSPGAGGAAHWMLPRDSPQGSSRMGDTPPSVEDESAQNLLDKFWQEVCLCLFVEQLEGLKLILCRPLFFLFFPPKNLVLDTMGNHEQIFPSNLQST